MNESKADTRTWTDADLQSAIAASHTWREVARTLRLSQSATPRLKRHARRLGLTTPHFRSLRRWSELDLQTALGASTSWPKAMDRLGIGDTPESRNRVRGYATRLGIGFKHLDGPGRPHDGAALVGITPRPKQYLRQAAEPLAAAWFTLRGIPVAVPTTPSAYDLLVTLPCGIRRVQVKSTTYQPSHKSYYVGIGHRPYSLDATAEKAPYAPDAVDYFLILDGDGNLYFIPAVAVAGQTGINVDAYRCYRIGSVATMFTACAAAS